uniref:Uncharacterized protein n=1 Tax=Echinococcus granulosus TaxID=6210 RepID=A0A068WQ17_ECHGR|nr:hypothetical protein EgrG_000507600 [Echinococcus granulosus]
MSRRRRRLRSINHEYDFDDNEEDAVEAVVEEEEEEEEEEQEEDGVDDSPFGEVKVEVRVWHVPASHSPLQSSLLQSSPIAFQSMTHQLSSPHVTSPQLSPLHPNPTPRHLTLRGDLDGGLDWIGLEWGGVETHLLEAVERLTCAELWCGQSSSRRGRSNFDSVLLPQSAGVPPLMSPRRDVDDAGGGD